MRSEEVGQVVSRDGLTASTTRHRLAVVRATGAVPLLQDELIDFEPDRVTVDPERACEPGGIRFGREPVGLDRRCLRYRACDLRRSRSHTATCRTKDRCASVGGLRTGLRDPVRTSCQGSPRSSPAQDPACVVGRLPVDAVRSRSGRHPRRGCARRRDHRRRRASGSVSRRRSRGCPRALARATTLARVDAAARRGTLTRTATQTPRASGPRPRPTARTCAPSRRFPRLGELCETIGERRLV
jgi:hypothetical protein